MSWAIIVHGGAKAIPADQADAHRRGCLEAVRRGAEVLERGGSAVDAAEAAVRALEDDPIFNAGFGSVLNADGEVEMDAAVMDGATLDVGAVAALKGVRHPVSVAKALLRERPVLLAGEGARAFAEAHGLEICAPEAMIAARNGQGCDTVGCVARDSGRDIAAATSTGGLEGVLARRVGDSPIPGASFWAENATGGVAFSGEGEAILRTRLAGRVMDALETREPTAAITGLLPLLTPLEGDAGGVAIDREGRIGWAHDSPQFAVAYARAGEPPRAYLHKDEETSAG